MLAGVVAARSPSVSAGALVPSLIRKHVVDMRRLFLGMAAYVCLVLSFEPAEAAVVAPGRLIPLASVRLLDGPFAEAVTINRSYLLAHDPDRLVAPFLREAGLEPKARPYGNWDSSGLDGHTAGHYLSAVATMIASGADTSQGELRSRLDYMLAELDRCQQASKDGYIGGVPGGRELWKAVGSGSVEAVNRKWVPWYNVHKVFAGLRDAYLFAGSEKARAILIRLGDWCDKLVAPIPDEQMQRMLGQEHGGMNEVLADIYEISGEVRFLSLARRFNHKAVLDPLIRHEDQLTGLHANTQIPKVIGLQRIAILTRDHEAGAGARFFWENVTRRRSVAFGGNSVSEHFNDPSDFRRMVESREGPETCNTYNMLRLTEQLYTSAPNAAYVDFYERALFNHILASIHPTVPGYVYFTPLRPAHYRVYSQPEKGFWCCVGTGMENPGRYGEFIYAQAMDGLFVNLFIASRVTVTNYGLTLQQETKFPDEPRTRLILQVEKPTRFTLHIRHPGWVATNEFSVRVNGVVVKTVSTPSSYLALTREWRNGDRVEIELPMRTTFERLPDGSDWGALLHGPIVLASPTGTNNMAGLRANDSRMGHVASGPTVPLDQAAVLLAKAEEIPTHIQMDVAAGPMRFRLTEVAVPNRAEGLPLLPFFRLHDARYQMYWQLTTKEALAARQQRLAAEERAKQAREAATLDAVAVGEQQPEVEHDFIGEGVQTGEFEGRRWRHGRSFQYTLDLRGEKAAVLAVTYSGSDRGRAFDLLVNGTLVATERLNGSRPGEFFEKRYPLPPAVISAAKDGHVIVRFVGRGASLAGGVYDVRLMRETKP